MEGFGGQLSYNQILRISLDSRPFWEHKTGVCLISCYYKCPIHNGSKLPTSFVALKHFFPSLSRPLSFLKQKVTNSVELLFFYQTIIHKKNKIDIIVRLIIFLSQFL